MYQKIILKCTFYILFTLHSIYYLIFQHGTLDAADMDDDDYDSETVTFHDALSSGEEDPELLLEDLEYD